jgi:hypothetical protein
VALYFGNEWCPPCKYFVSVLKDLYPPVPRTPDPQSFLHGCRAPLLTPTPQKIHTHTKHPPTPTQPPTRLPNASLIGCGLTTPGAATRSGGRASNHSRANCRARTATRTRRSLGLRVRRVPRAPKAPDPRPGLRQGPRGGPREGPREQKAPRGRGRLARRRRGARGRRAWRSRRGGRGRKRSRSHQRSSDSASSLRSSTLAQTPAMRTCSMR